MTDGVYSLLQISKEMGIPYWEIPIRSNNKRFGKFALIGFLQRLDESVEDEIEKGRLKAEGKGSETYSSDL